MLGNLVINDTVSTTLGAVIIAFLFVVVCFVLILRDRIRKFRENRKTASEKN